MAGAYSYKQIRQGQRVHICRSVGGQLGPPLCGVRSKYYWRELSEPFGALCGRCAKIKRQDVRS